MMMIQHPHFVYEAVAMTPLATITILIRPVPGAAAPSRCASSAPC
jgi:hypothetical protein